MSEREANRRALVEKVQECMALVNECAVGTEEVTKAFTEARAELADRLDVQGVWLKEVEEDTVRLGRNLLVEKREHADTRLSLAKLEAALEAQGDRATVALFRLQDEQRRFTESLTFWQRLRWIFTGRWPRVEQDAIVATGTVLPDPAVQP